MYLLTFAIVAPAVGVAAYLIFRYLERNGLRIVEAFDIGPKHREYYPHLVDVTDHQHREHPRGSAVAAGDTRLTVDSAVHEVVKL